MKQKKVILVEDEGILSGAFKSKVEKDGWDVFVANNVESGYKAIKENMPDVIVLDVLLPGGQSGFDLLKKIQLEPELQNIPVIVLTNLQNQETQARELGSVACLVKSNTSLDDIVDVLNEYKSENNEQ